MVAAGVYFPSLAGITSQIYEQGALLYVALGDKRDVHVGGTR